MSGKRYVVREGDTLWDIAEQQLGDPFRWPELFEHNNAEGVVNLSGSRIVDPDLILVGQVLYIPDQRATQPGGAGQTDPGPDRPNLRPEQRDRGRTRARREVYAPSLKLDLPSAPIYLLGTGYVAKVELKGSVTIQSNRPIEALTFTKDSFEVKAKHEASTVMQRLVGDAKFKFNPKTGEVTFENGLTIHSNHPYVPSAKVTMGVSATGLPVAKALIQAPTIRGRVNHYVYLSSNFAVVIEITPLQRPQQRPQLRPQPQPAPQPSRWPSMEVVVGVGLLVGVVILVTATIAEDIVTAGAGVADDPASFALAATMAHRGWALLRAGSAMVPVYVQGAGPAARMAVAR